MELQVLVVPECPHEEAAVVALHAAALRAGLGGALVVRLAVTTDELARRLQFRGSPTFMVDGCDLFPSSTDPALTCRLYSTPEGPRGLPSEDDLTAALVKACASRSSEAGGPAASGRADRD